MVLHLDCVAYIDELSVLEDEEVVFLSGGLEALDCLRGEISDDVDVCLEYDHVRSEACLVSLLSAIASSPSSLHKVSRLTLGQV